jgi:hypothetical protein
MTANSAPVLRAVSGGAPAMVASGAPKRRRDEEIIHRAVVDHLRARGVPGLVWWHTPNGARLGGRRNKRGVPIQALRFKELGVRAGVSDLILLHRGRMFALELKTESGRPTEAQMEFVSNVNSAGGFATIASGIDQALKVLKTWGLVRGDVQ